jgi:thiosulfate/3-mercaptopyruvate sulfurtransferase
MQERYARPELLIEPTGLMRRLNDTSLRVLDLRPEADYLAGHVPGATWLDEKLLRSDADKETYLPTSEALEVALRAAGVGGNMQVVAYDSDGRASARLWYVLNVLGFPRVSLLQGGFSGWAKANLPVSAEKTAALPGDVRLRRPGGGFFCPTTKVLTARRGTVLLDTRSPEEFTGEARSKGHVPGAVHVDWRENLDESGRFKPQSELRAMYANKGVTPDKEIVTYCASGGRASVSLFALTLIGYKKVRLYYGSYSDYAARPNLPLER